MEVILLQDVEFVGLAYELVEVKSGFARNYLIPKRFAEEANKSNLARLRAKQKVRKERHAQLLAKISEVVDILEAGVLDISVKTGTSGKIFGKLTSLQVARAIKQEFGYEIDRKIIEVPEITNVGLYTCKIKFNKGENTAELKLNLTA